MARKNRRRPFHCPVQGCPKRGLRADLVRHASALHPEVSRDAYSRALERGEMIGGKVELTPWARWNIRIVIGGAVLLAAFWVVLTLVKP